MVQRLDGIITGLDTTALVKALTLSQQSKIDKLKQQNTLGSWQQTEYRTIISKLNTFQNKYFSNTNPLTNLSSASSVTKYASTITNAAGNSSSAVSVSASGSVRNTSHTMEVLALAQKETWQSGAPVKMEGSALDADALKNMGGLSFAANVDGQVKAVTLREGGYNSVDELKQDLQNKLNDAFGEGKVTVGTTADGKSLAFGAGSGHSFGIGNIKGGTDGVVEQLGFEDLTFTTLNVNKTLDKIGYAAGQNVEFTINGNKFSFDPATTTMQDVFNKVNESGAGVRMYYSEINNAVVMESKNAGVANKINFTDGAGGLMTSLFGGANSSAAAASRTAEAKDSEFILDGMRTTRSSNTFEVEGITYTLNQVTGEGKSNAININLTQDTSTTRDLIVNFVKDYNELVGYINGKVREEKYSSYQPLTDDEKASMTEYEIKQHEEYAKSGLLQNDRLLRDALNGLSNSVFLSKGEGGVSAYSLGLMQSGSYSDGGQIKLDLDQLEKALRENPSAVESFFTDAANGLAKNMDSVLTQVASTDLLTQGTLVKKAGVPGKSSEYFNEISEATRNRNTQITTLLEALTKKQNDLYTRYAKMESTINSMQQQLSALSSLG